MPASIPEKAPANWDEMVAMGKKLVKKDGSGNVTRWGVEIPTTGYAYWMLQALAIENGQKLMNDAGNEVYLTAPKTVAALDYWVDLSRKDNVMPTGSIDWATLRTDFLEGKTAMMWHTTGNLTAVKDGAKFNFGVAMLPAKERRGSPTGGGSFYIFKSAIARAAEGGGQIHPVDDGARTRRRMEHQDRLCRGVAGGLQDPGDGEIRQGFPGRHGRARSARTCGAGTVGA